MFEKKNIYYPFTFNKKININSFNITQILYPLNKIMSFLNKFI